MGTKRSQLGDIGEVRGFGATIRVPAEFLQSLPSGSHLSVSKDGLYVDGKKVTQNFGKPQMTYLTRNGKVILRDKDRTIEYEKKQDGLLNMLRNRKK